MATFDNHYAAVCRAVACKADLVRVSGPCAMASQLWWHSDVDRFLAATVPATWTWKAAVESFASKADPPVFVHGVDDCARLRDGQLVDCLVVMTVGPGWRDCWVTRVDYRTDDGTVFVENMELIPEVHTSAAVTALESAWTAVAA